MVGLAVPWRILCPGGVGLLGIAIGALSGCTEILGVDRDYEVGPIHTGQAGAGGSGATGGATGGASDGGVGGSAAAGGQGGPGGAGGNPTVDSAPEFDGADDFIVANRPLSDELTIEAWIRTSVEGAGALCWLAPPLIYADQVGNVADFSSCILEGGRFGFSIGHEGGSNDEVLASSSAVNTGAWVHVAGAKGNDGHMRVFVNGTEDGHRNSGVTTPIVGPEQVLFGGNLIDDRYFAGRIREVRIWSRARTQAEIAADYDHRLVGDEPGLVGYWPLDDGAGSMARELTANSNHGTLGGGNAANMPAWIEDSPPLQ